MLELALTSFSRHQPCLHQQPPLNCRKYRIFLSKQTNSSESYFSTSPAQLNARCVSELKRHRSPPADLINFDGVPVFTAGRKGGRPCEAL